MNVQKTIKKILALGTGVTMVGATILGAAAYDLANYPSPFIANGVFDGSIVVGERAAAQDILGAIDIAASLQAMSVSKEAVQIPNQTGKVSLEGDSFQIGMGTDKLELREPIGDVVDTISEGDLAGLKSDHISTSEGDTDYAQYVRFKDGTNLQEMGVNYIADEDSNVMADYLVVDIDKPFIEWEMQFSKGLKSTIDTTDKSLDDIEDESLNIMGQDFNIVRATVDDADTPTSIDVILMGGALSDTLREGETKTYTLNGVEYEVTLIFVSDPQSGSNVEAKYMVNGEVTKSLQEGDTDTLGGGIQIGVRDILANARDGLSSFYLGADKLEMTDSNISSSDFSSAGTIEINQDSISDGEIEIAASTYGTNKLEITSIKYRLTMNGDLSSTAYVPTGHGLKEYMRYPRSLISDSFDVKYMGLEDVTTNDFKIMNRGDDRYQLTFTNIQGETYTFPYISNRDGTWKFGDDNYDLIFVEGSSKTDCTIGRNDYFVVSNNPQDKKSVTNVLRYRSFDKIKNTVDFEDLANSDIRTVIVDSTSGDGSLVIGGHTYTVHVNDTSVSEPTISVDLDASGSYGDVTKLTTWGGTVISLADSVYINSTLSYTTPTQLQGVVGNGLNISSDAAFSDSGETASVQMSMTVDSSLFDTTNGNEVLNWTVSRLLVGSNHQVDLTTGDSSIYYKGPLNDNANEYSKFTLDNKDDSSSDHKVGMTDYGVFVDHYNPTSSNDPDTLTMSIPEEQELPQVFVTMGSIETVEGGSGVTTEVVNPISVGLAVLDKDAPAVGTANLIVVGGPCVNTVAAELMGNPTECAAGFTAGKAMIKSYEENGKVAILIAGMNAEDTVGASYVLSNYADYAAFQGSEVEVVVPDLSNIVVQAVTTPPADDGTGDSTGDNTTV